MPYAGHILLGGIMDQESPTQAIPTQAIPTQAHDLNEDDATLATELANVADSDEMPTVPNSNSDDLHAEHSVPEHTTSEHTATKHTVHEHTIADDATIAMQQAAQQYTQESQTHGYPGAGAADTASTNAQDAYATYPGWQQPNARTLPKTRIIPATGPSVATIVWGVILAIVGVIGLSLVAGVSLDWHISAQTWGLLAIVIFVAIGLILVVTGIAASIQASKEHKSSTTTPHTSK